MEQFLSVNLVSLIQLVAYLGGGLWIVSAMKTVQDTQSDRLQAVERELHELRNVVVSIARQEERLNALDQRLIGQSKRIDICLADAQRRN